MSGHRNHSRGFAGPLARSLFDPVFSCYCLMYAINRLSRAAGAPLPLMNGWLSDFLFVPVVCHIALVLTRYLLRKPEYKYPLKYIVAVAVYSSVFFELILPAVSSKAIADPLDVVAYMGGAGFYYFVHQYYLRL